jgi:hypothetical protein
VDEERARPSCIRRIGDGVTQPPEFMMRGEVT